jgi:methyl-accepting chemotaxis protein
MSRSERSGRKQLLVNRPYQILFASRMVLVTFALATLSYLGAMAILWRYMHQPRLEARYYVIAGLMGAAITLLIELIVMIPILYYYGIRQSHRVVGPLQRIVAVLDALGQGDYAQRVTMRTSDVLSDLAKAINRMAAKLEQRHGRGR